MNGGLLSRAYGRALTAMVKAHAEEYSALPRPRPTKQGFATAVLKPLYPDEWAETYRQAKLDVEDEDERHRLFGCLEHVDETLRGMPAERPEVDAWLLAWYDRDAAADGDGYADVDDELELLG